MKNPQQTAGVLAIEGMQALDGDLASLSRLRADARLIREYLQETGPGHFDVDWVDCSSTALERLHGQSYDALLLDLSLPDSPPGRTLEAVLRKRMTVTLEVPPAAPLLGSRWIEDVFARVRGPPRWWTPGWRWEGWR